MQKKAWKKGRDEREECRDDEEENLRRRERGKIVLVRVERWRRGLARYEERNREESGKRERGNRVERLGERKEERSVWLGLERWRREAGREDRQEGEGGSEGEKGRRAGLGRGGREVREASRTQTERR